MMRYGSWTIEFDPAPYRRQFTWTYVHDDYDGAEDARDYRHGYGRSRGECIVEINALEAEARCYRPALLAQAGER